MNFSKLLDEFYNYLIEIDFDSAKQYRDWLEKIYHNFPNAKNLLDKIADEKDVVKQLKPCINLIEKIYYAKENEIDETIKSRLGDWHSVAMKLVDFIQSRVVIMPKGYLTEKNINAIFDGEVGLTMKKPYATPKKGVDQQTQRITYENNVLPNEQVSGLCLFLENEYECILGFARNIFGQWIDTLRPRRIPVVLKKECPAKVYLNNDEYVTQKINELIEQNKSITVAQTEKILRHTMRIAGKFFAKPEPHIEIYYRQFHVANWEDYASQITQVLAHEYMHYLEYAKCEEQGVQSFVDDRVSEAVADFFGVLYSIKRSKKYDFKTAKNCYDGWVKYWGSGWPYSYALLFYKKGKLQMSFSEIFSEYEAFGCIEKLQSVFSTIYIATEAFKKLNR